MPFTPVHGVRPRVTVHLNEETDRLILCAICNMHRCDLSTAVCFALRTWAYVHGVRPETLARENGGKARNEQ